ncbi:MAG: site-2 protease family protein [Candidatus Micrarchaeota archaeon]|nr:site-2 protease family protein [Candidatus Micrarchaeota archaeon]MDE1834802.1 site-2 protease family protein [Candidatus Micrarchaeota archaeon]MDE1859582.1 site-2 protease family protein [Candidatus Micrarchaeota archaeon]
MPKSLSSTSVKAAKQSIPKYNDAGLIRALAVLGVFLALLIYASEFTNWPLTTKLLVDLFIFIVGGFALDRTGGLQESVYFGRMMRSHFGLKMIDALASRAKWFWNGLADWGLVLGFGLLSFFIFKKLDRKMVLFGSVSLFFITMILSPFLVIGLLTINVPQLNSLVQLDASSALTGNINFLAIAPFSLLVAIFGFESYIMIALLASGASVLMNVLLSIETITTSHPNYIPLQGSVPGVYPILPGIDIPLISGLLALIVVLSVHEFAHGILCRISKVKVISSGLLVFGIIPIGAFVEPDEKTVSKLSVTEQNRIFAAGVATNMLITVIFFFPTLALFYSIMHSAITVTAVFPNSPANQIIAPGSIITNWNGYNVSTLSDFRVAAAGDTPGAKVHIITNQTNTVLTANATGKVGVAVDQIITQKAASSPILVFLFQFFALAFVLNFLIAIVNYLPLPGMDGWRIFDLNIKRKIFTFALGALGLVAIFLNVLPFAVEYPIAGIVGVLFVGLIAAVGIKWLWNWSRGSLKSS